MMTLDILFFACVVKSNGDQLISVKEDDIQVMERGIGKNEKPINYIYQLKK